MYSLPSIPQTITYPHAAVGYLVKDTWIDTVEAGNIVTCWTGLTAATARKHFPKSDETVKGHMKKQHQGVLSTKIKEEDVTDKTIPELGTHQNVATTLECSDQSKQNNQKTLTQIQENE
jgi:hypothetical protein